MTPTNGSVIVLAPAKLNLGLEILGKRDDGYHEIRSVMAAIDLCDRLTITPRTDDGAIQIDGVPDVALHDNLIYQSVQAFRQRTGVQSGYQITVEKHIPSPGGLGGASTDAAATLRALNAVHGEPLDRAELVQMAASLGSDVPFFLGPSPALASGTGTDLTPLTDVRGFAVLAVPRVSMAAKTATLYRSLKESDFRDGDRAVQVAASIERGELPDEQYLANAFTRPLYALVPELQTLASAMIVAGAPYAALSGAGPAHYALFHRETAASEVADRLTSAVPAGTLVMMTKLGSPEDSLAR